MQKVYLSRYKQPGARGIMHKSFSLLLLLLVCFIGVAEGEAARAILSSLGRDRDAETLSQMRMVGIHESWNAPILS